MQKGTINGVVVGNACATSTGADMNRNDLSPHASPEETSKTPAVEGRPLPQVLVVGSGAMGAQISMACALAGHHVTVQDISTDSLERAENSLREILERQVAKGRVTDENRDGAFARLHFTADLEQAAASADFVIEAAVETLALKEDLFSQLDALCPPHTILTSNSSSFVPSKLAAATHRPSQVCNLHFFNPALVMKCIEIVPGPGTSDDTIDAAVTLALRLGKEPIVMAKEITGFIANRILNAIRDEAVFLLEGGYASITDIDAVCRTALAHPMGPFELQDMTGLDIGYATKLARYEDSRDPADAPSRSLTDRIQAGHLGRKTGRGWYRYDASGNKAGEA
ncbi:3-hydroxyacyl-CoA dehydrogenase family protein [Actinomadura nitritigenes]|uniref:3-hydroxyacyl-CoA dehydrogenase family protein n=1 Tax=Actinomadura nitritigenes TaxID=134602 RepID=UPI003D8ABBE6